MHKGTIHKSNHGMKIKMEKKCRVVIFPNENFNGAQ